MNRRIWGFVFVSVATHTWSLAGWLVSQAVGEHFFCVNHPLLYTFVIHIFVLTILSQLRTSAFCLPLIGGVGGERSSFMGFNFQLGLNHSIWFGNGFKEYCCITFPTDRDETCSSSYLSSFLSPRQEFAFLQSSEISLV